LRARIIAQNSVNIQVTLCVRWKKREQCENTHIKNDASKSPLLLLHCRVSLGRWIHLRDSSSGIFSSVNILPAKEKTK
jgi:hypothetical protein